MIERAPLKKPLSSTEAVIVAMLASGQHNYHSIGEHLGISYKTVKFHAERAKAKIPGDLPTQLRLLAWYRGASLDVLTGSKVRQTGYQPISPTG